MEEQIKVEYRKQLTFFTLHLIGKMINFKRNAAEKVMREYPKSIFTIDVEDYFNVTEERGEPPVSEWDSLPSIVESGFMKLLALLDTYQVQATCFFLGYIAQKYPQLVKEAQKRGHEIASHGMYHRLIYKMSREEFAADLLQSKKVLEDISSEQVTAFRSPSFSFTEATPWFFETLAEAGFRADSSVFPVKRDYGGYKTTQKKPYWVTTAQGRICEFPISVAPFCGKEICFFGGGYLRLFPKRVILAMHKKLEKEGKRKKSGFSFLRGAYATFYIIVSPFGLLMYLNLLNPFNLFLRGAYATIAIVVSLSELLKNSQPSQPSQFFLLSHIALDKTLSLKIYSHSALGL